MALEKEKFECFASPLYKNGKRHLIGVSEAERLKEAAVLRGFATKSGVLGKRLSPLDMLVMAMRNATSADDFNHEWWAAEASKPEWVRKLDTVFRGGWLYFPTKKEDLTARTVGERINYQLALSERQLGRVVRERAYRERTQHRELQKAKRGFDPEDRKKVRIFIPGYKSYRELASEQYEGISMLRQQVMAVAGGLREEEFKQFIQGTAEGALRAQEVDLKNEASEFNEREEVVSILAEHWCTIHRLKTRRAVTDFIIAHLPESKRAFLEASRKKETPESPGQYKRLVERLRQTFYEKIGLRPAGRGRPEN